MENSLQDPIVGGTLIALAIKFKSWIGAGIMACLSSAYKYRKDRKDDKVPKVKSFFSYLFVTSMVIFTALGVMEYMGFEINLLGYMIMFWCGQSSDYLFIAVERGLKAFTEKKIKKLGDE